MGIKRRGFLQGAAALAVGTTVVGCDVDVIPGGDDETPSSGPVIAIDAGAGGPKVSPLMTGVNGAKWYDDGFGMWDAKENAPDPDVVKKVKQSGVGLVRYPGGTSSNLFNWQGAIGPQADRTGQVEGKQGAPVDSGYGPDEYMAFVKAADLTPQIMAPFVGSTPDEIADWVAYMNAPEGTKWGDLRAENGHPEPYRVRHWEIGNELFGKHQRYWMSADDKTALRQYAFGGTQRQRRQPAAKPADHRPEAGVSDGEPDQTFTVRYPPVVPESQAVHVNRVSWHQVDDLSSANARDRVYTFEPGSGTICFGDGRHGRIPPEGAKITVDYDSGPHAGFVDFYKAMKAADATIDVLACWASIDSGEYTTALSFPRLMAKHGHADEYDGVSIHPYTDFSRDLKISSFPDKRAGHDFQMIGELAAGKMVTDLQADVRKYGKDDAYVAVSECGALFFGGKRNTKAYPEYAYAMSHALYMASQWARFTAAGIPWTAGNDLIGERPGVSRTLLGGAPGFIRTPDALVREQLRGFFHGGGHAVETGVRDNVKVSARETVLGSSYSALMATAAIDDDGALGIVVVNRSPDKDIKARIQPEQFRHAGSVEVSVVSGDSYDDFNDARHPHAVGIEKTKAVLRSQEFSWTFTAHSVTLLRCAAR